MTIQLRLPDDQRRLLPVALDDLIRVGRDHDGGYVLPRRVLNAADSILALGLFDDWSFETELVQIRPQLRVDAYDHTVSRKRFLRAAWIDAIRLAILRGSVSELSRRIRTLRDYDRFFVGAHRHFEQKITNLPSGEAENDLTGALDRLGGTRTIVKMDIEGCEYRVIDQLAANAYRVVGACVEFHDTDPFRIVFEKAIDVLLPHYSIAHVHPNNYGKVAIDGLPDVLEITFVNRSLITSDDLRTAIYLPGLDQPNDPSSAELELVH